MSLQVAWRMRRQRLGVRPEATWGRIDLTPNICDSNKEKTEVTAAVQVVVSTFHRSDVVLHQHTDQRQQWEITPTIKLSQRSIINTFSTWISFNLINTETWTTGLNTPKNCWSGILSASPWTGTQLQCLWATVTLLWQMLLMTHHFEISFPGQLAVVCVVVSSSSSVVVAVGVLLLLLKVLEEGRLRWLHRLVSPCINRTEPLLPRSWLTGSTFVVKTPKHTLTHCPHRILLYMNTDKKTQGHWSVARDHTSSNCWAGRRMSAWLNCRVGWTWFLWMRLRNNPTRQVKQSESQPISQQPIKRPRWTEMNFAIKL